MILRCALEGILHVEVSGHNEIVDVGVRVCVTGGRTFDDLGFVWSHLDVMHNLPAYLGGRGPIRELGVGCAEGVDDLALKWCIANNVPWQRYVADWDRLGLPAGAIRNGVMLEDFKPDLLMVYPGNVGTTDCARKARKMKIEREFYTLDDGDPFVECSRWG